MSDDFKDVTMDNQQETREKEILFWDPQRLYV